MTAEIIPIRKQEHIIPDHEFREMVNDIRDIAIRYHNFGCLRELIRKRISDSLKRSDNGETDILPAE
ncbi:hypothetical protein [Erwinia rhapontici]|uniref:hypothetical protein n=1 Tax=Erwinia rhapontici TaxID=55212 RepID=UPI00133196D1|nr:hypothetical protein [Erwinia rhapontici]MBP2156889.1 hypothetical protein [Erwinia rhapontici]